MIFPSFVFSTLAKATAGLRKESWNDGSFFAGIFQEMADAFQRQSYIYTVCYIILIYFFCYFWTAITFNPKDMADNFGRLRRFHSGLPAGAADGRLSRKVMLRIAYVGAAFLALVAVIPSLVQTALRRRFHRGLVPGPHGLLIVMSVCLDLVQKIDGHPL